MNVSINILFVAHPRHNTPQLLGRKFFRQFFHLALTGLRSYKVQLSLHGREILETGREMFLLSRHINFTNIKAYT